MILIVTIDLVVVLVLVFAARRKGVEGALPYFAFFVTLLPEECRISLPGLFELYTHRLALLVLAALFYAGRRRARRQAVPFKNLMILHAIWAVASTLTSIVQVTSFKQFLAQVLEYYLLYYIFVKSTRDPQTIPKVMYSIVAAIGVCSVFGLLEVYARWSVLSLFPAELQQTYGTGYTLYSDMFDRGIRSRATFPHPIHFGAAIAMVVPLVLYLLTRPESKWVKKALLNIGLVLMFWSLYKTGSRGPWLATALVLAILTLAANSKIRKRVLTIAVLGVAVLVCRPGITDTLVNMYTASLDPASEMGSSLEYRPALFRTVRQTLNDDLLRATLGFGLGSFREKGLVVKMPNVEDHRWYTCDSSWILFWYETGYVGVVILGILLLRPAFLAFRGFRRSAPSERYVNLVFFCSLTAFYFVMLSVAMYGWGQNGHIAWTMIALSSSYGILKREEKQKLRPVTLPSVGVSPWSFVDTDADSYQHIRASSEDSAEHSDWPRQSSMYLFQNVGFHK